MIHMCRVAVFAAFALPITVFDLREMRIPDALSLGGTALAAILSMLRPGFSTRELALEVLVSFGVFWALSVATGGKLGLGDAKYSLFIAVSLGTYGWLTTIAVAAVTGLAAALVLVARDRAALDTRIPFAPFLTLGAVVTLAMQGLLPAGLPT